MGKTIFAPRVGDKVKAKDPLRAGDIGLEPYKEYVVSNVRIDFENNWVRVGLLEKPTDTGIDFDYLIITETLEEVNPSESALDVQVGGSHYKDMTIQPIEFTHKNNLNFCQGNIIKYACRYKSKNGKEDLEKVIHYAQLLIDLEYSNE